MADVTDVTLTPFQDPGAPAITLVQPGTTGMNPHVAVTGAVNLTSPKIHAIAGVTVRGTPGEDVSFWRFGFIQLKFITDEWAHYRGDTPAEGSIFVAMDRPPARPQQLCRDSAGFINPFARLPYLELVIFYYPEEGMLSSLGDRITGVLPLGKKIPASGKMALAFIYMDSPGRSFAIDLTRVNHKVPTLNFLYSLYSGNAYVTMFAVQKGVGQPIEVMKSFQWNVRWRAHFGRNNIAGHVLLPPRPGDVTDMNISHVVNGPPNDPLFRRSILDTRLPNCLNVVQHAFTHPVVLESTRWEDWKVQH
jgi:hypothetical protein